MNVDRLNRYCVKLVKRLNVVSRKGKILSKIYKIYIWNNKYCYRHWKIINVLKIWYIVVYKNLFYFSLLLVYKSNTLSVYVSRIISRDTRRKKIVFVWKYSKLSLFFFLQSRISLHPSRMIDPTTVDLSESVRNAISVCCCLSFHPCLLLFSPFLFFLILSILACLFPFCFVYFPYKREISRGSRIKRDNWKIVTGCSVILTRVSINTIH